MGTALPLRADDGPTSVKAAASPGGSSAFVGALAALAAFLLWGILPVFWKALASVDAFEVLCHRICWSFVMLLPCMFFKGRLGGLLVALRRPGTAPGLLCSGALLAGNWYLYIWAINSGMVVEASLGYFINPLVSILFGIAVFREQAGRLVWAAIGIATCGVAWQVVALGSLPLVPLGLAFSFGIYALLRKLLQVQALPGLFVETLVVLPFAAGWLLWQAALGNSAFFRGEYAIDALLIGAGAITTLPLLLFAYGAKNIRMTTLGILQYSSPTCVFLLGVFVYGEPFTTDRLITFCCIWAALALYTWESVRRHAARRGRAAER